MVDKRDLLPVLNEPAECLKLFALRTSPLSTSPRDDALIAANDGLNRSLVDVFRTRSKVGTDPFFGKPNYNTF